MKFYVIILTDTNYKVDEKDNVGLYYKHISFLLSFLVQYSKKRF